MIKVIFNTLLAVVVCLLLVNKFYMPVYCEKFSWKSVQYSFGTTNWMKKCADNKLCKIGTISNNQLWDIKIKNWKCIPAID